VSADFVLDLRMPGEGGRPALRRIRARWPADTAAARAALPNSAGEILSDRDNDVPQLIALGRSPPRISQALGWSAKTVANCRALIRHKLGASSAIQMLRIAMETGAVRPALITI